MSEMSYLEKLLDGVDVEWLPLSDLARIRNGKDHKSLSEGEFPVYGSGGIMRYVDTYAYNKPSVLIPRKGSLGNLFFVDVPFWTVDTIFYTEIDEAQIRPKYLYYFLTTVGLGEMNQAGGVPSQTQSVLNKLKIPIPCPGNPEKSLAIQSVIVRILDKFSALTAELTAELTMRKKQYNYYRDQLFSFGAHDVKRLKLGELCVIGDGLHGTPEYDANGDYFFINGNNLGYQKISFNDNTKKVNDPMFKKHGIHFDPINTVFLSINGTIGNVSFYNNEKIVLGKSVAYFKIKSPELHTRYLFYFLQTNYAKQYFENQKTGSTIKNLGLKSLRAFEIPIPSYDEQLYIVATMDKFYNLTNSITEGLPREIELRQKQYEYYRDLLFSFPKPETVSN
ncbi:restriction endonuclease subunit S [Escherichia coli]|nr:restriction endonuclease subunit S [Escherichia coli]